jgi:hypothetical protein
MADIQPRQHAWQTLLLWLMAMVGGVFIYEQGIANKLLAQHVGSYPHAGFISLLGSVLIGWLILAPFLLLVSATFALLRRQLHWRVLNWEYRLNFIPLLREMTKPGQRRWWFVGVPGGAFLPLISYSVVLIGPMPTTASSLAGWAAYAAWGVRQASHEVRRWVLAGLAATFVGVGFGIAASNIGLAAYSNDWRDYWIALVMFAVSASIMWQLTTLGRMGAIPNSSRLAGSLVSWKGGALTALGGIVLFWQFAHGLGPISLNDLPLLSTHWESYLGMVYGVGIIMIGAMTSRQLGPVRFIVALAAGYAAAGFYDSLSVGLHGIAILLGVFCCLWVVVGVWMTMRAKTQPQSPIALQEVT